ncbi:anti-sigma regulatory factor (Ser/Thr protein kinase) [Haloactinospora alba]|uniref:Anti-sigma regulatory factor (Ser/Thr protein kinase) n=1 Tax=Haloactinospora alba TaxID=405555 RepID=A0A543NLF2_9ACTN|nr:anti-sigma regulatory factor (Ser/Thr protein kinase) [Haloactinospora alba]
MLWPPAQERSPHRYWVISMSAQEIQRLHCHAAGTPHELVRLRQWLRDQLDYAPDSIRIYAEHVLAEAASNAIQHSRSGEAGGIYEVIVICYPVLLRGLVIDAGPKAPVALPEFTAAGPLDEHGRGFSIIDAFCKRWEFIPRPVGSLTWFELDWDTTDSLCPSV